MTERDRRDESSKRPDDEKKREEDLDLKFRKDGLIVHFTHQQTQTQEGYDALVDRYQSRFSQREEREIPRDEISVWPRVGETLKVRTGFVVKPGEPLWIGLQEIHENNPATLAKLATDLEKHREAHPLNEVQGGLIAYTVQGLREIIEPKDKPGRG